MRQHRFSFERRVAVITGGGTGIGRGISLALARRGVQLVLVGRRVDPLMAVTAEAAALGAHALPLALDITAPAAAQTIVDLTCATFGRLDILVNNAGLLAGGALGAQPAATVTAAVATNLAAPLELTRVALPHLAAQRGAVLLVGSTMSHVPLPYATLYSATKAGLAAFGAALRYEAADLGVHVLTVYPPGADSALTQGMQRRAPRWSQRPADPVVVGEQIVARLERGETEALWGAGERLLVWLHRFSPQALSRLLMAQRRRFARLMADG